MQNELQLVGDDLDEVGDLQAGWEITGSEREMSSGEEFDEFDDMALYGINGVDYGLDDAYTPNIGPGVWGTDVVPQFVGLGGDNPFNVAVQMKRGGRHAVRPDIVGVDGFSGTPAAVINPYAISEYAALSGTPAAVINPYAISDDSPFNVDTRMAKGATRYERALASALGALISGKYGSFKTKAAVLAYIKKNKILPAKAKAMAASNLAEANKLRAAKKLGLAEKAQQAYINWTAIYAVLMEEATMAVKKAAAAKAATTKSGSAKALITKAMQEAKLRRMRKFVLDTVKGAGQAQRTFKKKVVDAFTVAKQEAAKRTATKRKAEADARRAKSTADAAKANAAVNRAIQAEKAREARVSKTAKAAITVASVGVPVAIGVGAVALFFAMKGRKS